MVAVVAEVELTAGQIAPEDIDEIRGHYFTLEKGTDIVGGGGDITLLCAWDESRHSNFGQGPSVDVDEFVAAIEAHLSPA